MKVTICGGHLTPALAVIGELKKRGIRDIFYVGRSSTMEGDNTPSAESTIIPNINVKFYSVPTGRFQRKFTRHTITSLLKIPVGLVAALLILSQERPNLVISFGSYVAFPVVAAAWILGIPAITHEQTLKGGLANRIISRLAKRIALSWPDSQEYFPKEKTVVIGNPIRKEVLSVRKQRTSIPVVFVTGGNQGAHAINEAVLEIIEELVKKYEVIHQTGSSEKYRDYEILAARVSQLPRKLQRRYTLSKWVNSEELAQIYSRASIVVGRSGANTVSEVAAVGVPAIFIPLPWAGANEQEKSAQMLVGVGMALVLNQERLTPKRLLSAINSMMAHLDRYKNEAKKAKKLINPSAAEQFVDEAVKLVNKSDEI
ncbi:MAG: UDP-N-acetylglucosamine--N-acetylmuramyl-(pentapeptide) pyrophosphoryl-undecaprenol N-acetylglucosamine transferase [Candidatus Woykebacteria bacterium]